MKLIYIPLLFFLTTDSVFSNDTENPIVTKYRYEGPDGCNSEECYCSTETTIVQNQKQAPTDNEEKELVDGDGGGSSSGFIVKTLKCQDKADVLFYLKLPASFSNFISTIQKTIGQIWDKTKNLFSEAKEYLLKTKDDIATTTSPYLDRIHKNVNNAYQYTADKTTEYKEHLHPTIPTSASPYNNDDKILHTTTTGTEEDLGEAEIDTVEEFEEYEDFIENEE